MIFSSSKYQKHALSVFALSTVLAACQSSNDSEVPDTLSPTTQSEAGSSLKETNTAVGEKTVAKADNEQPKQTDIPKKVGSETPQTKSCLVDLANGPPPKPARGADFGQAVAKNTGKNIQRNILTQVGGQIAGGLGAAVAGGLGQATIRNEEDIKGTWTITDGSPNCGCQLTIDSIWKLTGRGTDKGQIKTKGCNTETLNQIAEWSLGYSFTGYDSKFKLLAKDKSTVLATLNRDGIHYFAGTMQDGTPVTMWRSGQNYNALGKQ